MNHSIRCLLVVGLLPVLQVQDLLGQQSDEIEQSLSLARARPAEQRWRSIRWVDSLHDAFERAAAEGKPVFYFGADGILASGNC
jgi:hypothetical protein